MNKLLIGLALLINPIFLFAHYPLSAKYYLEANDEISILNIYLSQAGVERAMIAQYGVDEVNSLSANAYKELIVGYVKANFLLKVDGNEIELQEGGIKLSDHQTDLKFITIPLPASSQEYEIAIPAFAENEGHQTIFSYNIHGQVGKEILSSKNEFKSSISFETEQASNWPVWILGGLAIALFIIIPMFKDLKNTKIRTAAGNRQSSDINTAYKPL